MKRTDPTIEWAAQMQLYFGAQINEVREDIINDLRTLQEELQEDTRTWFEGLKPHIQEAYTNKRCSDGIVQIPLMLHLLNSIKYPTAELS
jgi:hypothetical protein